MRSIAGSCQDSELDDSCRTGLILAMLLLRMSSSLTTLSIIFFELSSTIRHFHYTGKRVRSQYALVRQGGRSWSYVALCDVLDLVDDDYTARQLDYLKDKV
jgi:hypothetical protein